MSTKLPIGNSVNELLIGDGDPVVFLPLLHFNFDFILFSKVLDLLNWMRSTLGSMQPCLTPSLFIATKFLSGSLTLETV